MRRAGRVLWAVLLMFVASEAIGSSDGALALVGGLLIDGTGSEPIEDAVVVIRGDLIVEAGAIGDVVIPGNCDIIDVRGSAILPGFVNAHVHDGYREENLRAWARGGVTTVRDLGVLRRWTRGSREGFALRDRLNSDPRNARLVASGPLVTTVGGYGGYAVSSADDAREKIDELIDTGADAIKIAIEDNLQGRIWPLLSPDEVAAIVETAHARGVVVSAHVSRSEHVQTALDAGVDDVAHMAVDRVSSDLIEQMVEQGMVWVPTMELWACVAELHDVHWWLAAASMNLADFVAAGGRVALGTDFAGYTCSFDLGMPMTEIDLMADAGMAPMQIIVAATRNGAIACGIADEVGTIEPGKIADVIVVDGNPLERIDALRDVWLVVHIGEVIRNDR
ncbi:amidohydrolase family protein [Candidatus Bipolaricaulota bacterium]